MLRSKNYIMVFDIETIPDTNAAFNLTGFDESDIIKQREELVNYHMEITDGKNPFLRQLFHKVITISYAKIAAQKTQDSIRLSLEEVRSAGDAKSTEKELVSWFFQIIDKYQPGLISFNGRTFDIPVLKYRAMAHGISCKAFYSSGDKWNNYNQRYNTGYHYDLIDNLSDFGASARIKLSEICAVLGYPGKFGVKGEDVTRLYDEGKITEIRNYCETDVLNTYLVYLRYALHSAAIGESAYCSAVEQVAQYLLHSDKKHFQNFFVAWQKAAKHSIDAEILYQRAPI